MSDATQNSPMKEFSYALIGVVLFLGIVLLIGISAFLRPAGNHVASETVVDATSEEVTPEAEATPEADTTTSDSEEAPVTQMATAEIAATDAESSVTAEEAVAANVVNDDTLAKTQPTTGNISSDDVVVADDMSVGGEGVEASQ